MSNERRVLLTKRSQNYTGPTPSHLYPLGLPLLCIHGLRRYLELPHPLPKHVDLVYTKQHYQDYSYGISGAGNITGVRTYLYDRFLLENANAYYSGFRYVHLEY